MTRKMILVTLAAGALLITGCGSDSSVVTDEPQAVTPEATNEVAPKEGACQVSGSTVLVDEGTTCTNDGDTLSCTNSRVTLTSGGSTLTAGTITINGKVYTCQ